jgi:transmembrane sensor
MEQLEKRFLLAQWIAKDISGTLTDDERAKLNEWISESTSNREEFQEIRKDILDKDFSYLEFSHPHFSKVWKSIRHRIGYRIIPLWLKYACILLLVLSIGGFIFYSNDKNADKIYQAKGEITLYCSDGQVCTFESHTPCWFHINQLKKINASNLLTKNRFLHKYNTIIVPRGCEFRIQLNDGSRICLNSESELMYPDSFKNPYREISLAKGEAYFDIAHNKDKPFIVHVNNKLDIKVLGTQFNVSCYENENEITTTLTKGKILIIGKDKNHHVLNPHEQLSYNKFTNRSTWKEIDDNLYTAWTKGYFVFEDQSLEDIMKCLGRWYDMNVVFDKDVTKRIHLSGEIEKSSNFEKVISMIKEVTNVDIKIKKDKSVNILRN